MKKKPEPKIPTSFRISQSVYVLLYQIAAQTGLGRAAVLELAIRRLARAEGVK